jgi:hypothetical protein
MEDGEAERVAWRQRRRGDGGIHRQQVVAVVDGEARVGEAQRQADGVQRVPLQMEELQVPGEVVLLLVGVVLTDRPMDGICRIVASHHLAPFLANDVKQWLASNI